MSFTAELTFQTKFSEFRWEARTSGVVITDAYEDGHGIAMSRLAGLLTHKKASRGPALDRGEVQRYLSSLMLAQQRWSIMLHWSGPQWLNLCCA